MFEEEDGGAHIEGFMGVKLNKSPWSSKFVLYQLLFHHP